MYRLLLCIVGRMRDNKGKVLNKWSNLVCSVDELQVVRRAIIIQADRMEEDSSADFCQTFAGAGWKGPN